VRIPRRSLHTSPRALCEALRQRLGLCIPSDHTRTKHQASVPNLPLRKHHDPSTPVLLQHERTVPPTYLCCPHMLSTKQAYPNLPLMKQSEVDTESSSTNPAAATVHARCKSTAATPGCLCSLSVHALVFCWFCAISDTPPPPPRALPPPPPPRRSPPPPFHPAERTLTPAWLCSYSVRGLFLLLGLC
jgi:hypothetical protein